MNLAHLYLEVLKLIEVTRSHNNDITNTFDECPMECKTFTFSPNLMTVVYTRMEMQRLVGVKRPCNDNVTST